MVGGLWLGSMVSGNLCEISMVFQGQVLGKQQAYMESSNRQMFNTASSRQFMIIDAGSSSNLPGPYVFPPRRQMPSQHDPI